MDTKIINIRPGGEPRPVVDVITEIIVAGQHGPVRVKFSGPEPTRHTYLRTLVEHAKIRGHKVIVCTNGGSRPRHYRRLAEAGVDGFEVPADLVENPNASIKQIDELGLLLVGE